MMINDLQNFIVLARERNFNLAAQACNVPQITVEMSICELEKYLEARLITTQSNLISLTIQGERALSWAKKIIEEYEMMQADLSGVGARSDAGVLGERPTLRTN
jgi:DNA-binding transcriptional LysR family regulator